MPTDVTVDRSERRADARVLTLVGSGHFFSHFYGIVLPPLFPLLQADLDVSYAALGLLISAFNVAGMTLQVPVGILVDRFGARPLLIAGLGLIGGGIAAAGLVSSYPALLLVIVLAGAGNSVFHPADYAILSARISPGRLGRAFSLHTFAGHVGWTVAPATVVFLTGLWNWRVALVLLGLAGLAVMVLMVVFGRALDAEGTGSSRPSATAQRTVASGSATTAPPAPGGLRVLLTLPILLFFLYMVMTSISSGGLNGFTVAVLVEARGADLAGANAVLTAFLMAGAAGVLLGGHLADRTRRHDLVVAGGFIVGAGVLVVVGFAALPLVVVTAAMALVGLAQGLIRPSRDMMIRAATPAGSVGKVFGFVTAGINVGGTLAPVIFGWLIDRGDGSWTFLLAAATMLLALGAALLANRAAR